MMLSILICTIESRKDQFIKLYDELQRQIGTGAHGMNLNSRFEILYSRDNKEKSIGSKRQELIERATGIYVVFIDDDDWISDKYIENLNYVFINDLGRCQSIGFKIECDIEGKKELAIAKNTYSDWCENKDGYKYCRTPYHKTPVKKEIALHIGYKDMRFGEDYDYSKRLKESKLIISEKFINEVMYFYNYKWENPKTKYGIIN